MKLTYTSVRRERLCVQQRYMHGIRGAQQMIGTHSAVHIARHWLPHADTKFHVNLETPLMQTVVDVQPMRRLALGTVIAVISIFRRGCSHITPVLSAVFVPPEKKFHVNREASLMDTCSVDVQPIKHSLKNFAVISIVSWGCPHIKPVLSAVPVPVVSTSRPMIVLGT